jgi:hypothetical protein
MKTKRFAKMAFLRLLGQNYFTSLYISPFSGKFQYIKQNCNEFIVMNFHGGRRGLEFYIIWFKFNPLFSHAFTLEDSQDSLELENSSCLSS